MSNKEVTMPFGRFKGVLINKIPNSYLRWLITVPEVPEYVKVEAKKKLKESDFDNTDIEITRHAIDMFSKRFLDKWTDRSVGIGTFVAHMAWKAISEGEEISDSRAMGKGVKIAYNGMVWVVTWSDEFPQFKTLITVMPSRKA